MSPMAPKKRYRHPELQEGEVFGGNTTEEAFWSRPWKTKRLGRVAYNIHTGQVLDQTGMPDHAKVFPWFVKRSELEAAGNPASLLKMLF